MTNEIIIDDYDLEHGGQYGRESDYQGVDVDGKQYVFRVDDYVGGKKNQRGLRVPRKAYQVVKYTKETATAKAREVTDPSLLEKIAFAWRIDTQEMIEELKDKRRK